MNNLKVKLKQVLSSLSDSQEFVQIRKWISPKFIPFVEKLTDWQSYCERLNQISCYFTKL